MSTPCGMRSCTSLALIFVHEKIQPAELNREELQQAILAKAKQR